MQGCYEAAKDHLLYTDFSWYSIVIGVGSAVSGIVVHHSMQRSYYSSHLTSIHLN